MIGRNKKNNKKPFFHDQIDTKIHDTCFLFRRYMWLIGQVKMLRVTINRVNRGEEGLGLILRLDGRGFRTWS